METAYRWLSEVLAALAVALAAASLVAFPAEAVVAAPLSTP